MKATKEINVYRMYKGRPARIRVVVPAQFKEEDLPNLVLTKENVIGLDYLDEELDEKLGKDMVRLMRREISEEVVERIPRKRKKQVKKGLGIPSNHSRVKIIRSRTTKYPGGYNISLRIGRSKAK